MTGSFPALHFLSDPDEFQPLSNNSQNIEEPTSFLSSNSNPSYPEFLSVRLVPFASIIAYLMSLDFG
jgi:hypothetical protein